MEVPQTKNYSITCILKFYVFFSYQVICLKHVLNEAQLHSCSTSQFLMCHDCFPSCIIKYFQSISINFETPSLFYSSLPYFILECPPPSLMPYLQNDTVRKYRKLQKKMCFHVKTRFCTCMTKYTAEWFMDMIQQNVIWCIFHF